MRAPTSVLVWTSEAPDPRETWKPRVPAIAEGSPYDEHGMDRRNHSHICWRCYHEHRCAAPLRMVQIGDGEYEQFCDDPSPLWLSQHCCKPITVPITGAS